ncbi:uncharacterized protein proca1 [Melanotaenia boesemani]|uniref:uncharacterized protein proca1 n=1 Tax=Melanotaenia boesemani TaxID=1250792 RepID=UPI001C041AD2|nr:uncharacterized protein proca1 [Melanotaenia boesemani]
MWSVFFVFLSYLDRNVVKGDFLSRALHAEKESKEMFSMINGTFCAKMSIIGDHFLYQVSDGAEVVRTVVSPAGKLVNCSVTVNQMQVKSFMHECRLGLKEQGAAWQMETHFARMDQAKMMCREFKERSARSSRLRRDDSEVLKRSKRGFTYPGTLWCGAGNMADDYNQLGEFADTDSCCRIHDHCPQVIHAFSSNYGYTNFKWHSICHCDCDNALKACLRQVNDTSSRVVGQAFFNVIGVPCFEFAYEEQCAERHWYGLCKRYEKLPIAVLKEAVPYDFGGIDVIDELPIAPSKQKDSKKSNEGEKPESSTQATGLGPEEPSLRNVVTAAEDFIKVLATVSTSQSSTADSGKDEAQSSEKKKKKNTGKKKKINKKQKGKRKGRKRKQKAETGVKTEEGAAVSPSGSKAEEVLALSNFISKSHRYNRPSINTNRVDDSEYELRVKDEPSNDIMKDEPAIDKETVSSMTLSTVQKKPVESDTAVLKEEITLSTSTETAVPQKVKTKGKRKGRRKKSNKTLSSEDLATNTSENLNVVTSPTITTSQPEQQSFTEQQLFDSSTSAPIVIPKAQRIRSKGRRDREGRKKRRKLSSAAPTVPADHQNSSVDSLKVVPFTGTPTIQSVPTTELQLSHRPDIYRERIQVTALSSTVSVLKRQRLKDRRLRNRRRKTAVSPSSENPLFSHSSAENMPTALTTPDTYVALNHLASTAEIQQTQWRLFTTATPTVSEKFHRQPTRQQRKARKKAAALRDVVPVPKQTEPVTLATSPFNAVAIEELGSENPLITMSAAPIISPLQLSIEKAKAQFNRKKRMKSVQSKRHS